MINTIIHIRMIKIENISFQQGIVQDIPFAVRFDGYAQGISNPTGDKVSNDLGFPWGAIGYSIAGRPMLIQTAAFLGLFGLGMLVVIPSGAADRITAALTDAGEKVYTVGQIESRTGDEEPVQFAQ